MALNAPIQGSAADIIKVAMLRVDEALREQGLRDAAAAAGARRARARGRAGGARRVEALVRAAMGGAAELSVPLEVSVGVGRVLARGRALAPVS